MGSPEHLRPARALTIAGSDSGGGAGIQADLKTFLACGVHGMSAIVALTAQNTVGVSAIHEVPPGFVTEQILQVVTDIGVDAAKTGMLSSARIVEEVADAVTDSDIKLLVVDPVFVSKSRDKLLADDAIATLVSQLLPKAFVLTPNLFEATVLTGVDVVTQKDMADAVKRLHDMGPRYVFLKGGHLESEAVDLLYDGSEITEYSAARIDTKHTHGTGCTVSAAVCAYLAKGSEVGEAVAQAKRFVTGAISHGLALGKGHGPTNHGWESTLR